jgi:hypothetical protein
MTTPSTWPLIRSVACVTSERVAERWLRSLERDRAQRSSADEMMAPSEMIARIAMI